MIQLIANPDQWTTNGLKQIATYADGVGPSLNQVFSLDSSGQSTASELIAEAHRLGLVVHPYTIRKDALPAHAVSLHDLMQQCRTAKIDGVFTDFPQ